jgi:NAD(P)-dependent dehydrogenase (short-subunit alcohol dehydrogenase family)
MDSLKGKGAVVTGAASGIGNAIATAFIEGGARVLLCDLNSKALDAAARGLSSCACGRVTDVSDESEVEAAVRAAREAFGSLDIVVNCAGFGAIAPLTELTGKEWRSVQAVTLKRPVQAEEIAAAAAFLASAEARSIYGDTIAIDGSSATRSCPALLTGLKKVS